MTRKSSDPPGTDELAKAVLEGRGEGLPFARHPGGELRREDFRPEMLDAIRRAGAAIGETWVMSDEAREATRQEILSRHPPGADLYIFGYGSLMWNPAMEIEESLPAAVRGYHRAFCLSLRVGRGSPEAPGLMLALMRGGSCRGRAVRIAAARIDSETRILWMREMMAGAYRPVWVRTRIADEEVAAITFTVNPANERFIGKLDPAETARRIATGRGVLGNNRDYLYRTVAELDKLGITDGAMHRLAARVRAIAGE